jgi:hypothetical protein
MIMSHNSVYPPSSDHDDVQTFKRTMRRVKKAAEKKTEELECDQIGTKVNEVVKRLQRNRRLSGFPRSGTDG